MAETRIPCCLVRRDVVLTYIYPFGSKWDNYAKRFAARYQAFKPVTEHHLVVIANGGKPPTKLMKDVFKDIDCEWMVHSNEGWDIGAYQMAAKRVHCEIMVMFGASTYFKRKGWLESIVDSHDRYGLGIYGAMGNSGSIQQHIWPHIRTTGWWLNPEILDAYPIPISHTRMRYQFEHGPACICEWAKSQGLKRWVTAFDKTYRLEDCDKIPDGFHKGHQNNMLCGDRLTEPPHHPFQ